MFKKLFGKKEKKEEVIEDIEGQVSNEEIEKELEEETLVEEVSEVAEEVIEELKEEIIEEVVVEKIEEVQKVEAVKKTVVKPPIKKIVKKVLPEVPQINTQEIQRKNLLKKRYFNDIKTRINKNKSYPKRAIRRGVQGDTKVKFILSSKGELLSFKILEGKKIFNGSVQKAIKNSFPFLAPQDLFSEDIILTLTIKYTLN